MLNEKLKDLGPGPALIIAELEQTVQYGVLITQKLTPKILP